MKKSFPVSMAPSASSLELATGQPVVEKVEIDLEVIEGIIAAEESEQLRVHHLDHYCRQSRRLSGHQRCKPAYVGYSVTPPNLLGLCR